MLFCFFASSAKVPEQQNVSSSGCGVNSRMVFFSSFSNWTGCALRSPASIRSNVAIRILIIVPPPDPISGNAGDKGEQSERDIDHSRGRENVRPADERNDARQRIEPHPERTFDIGAMLAKN